MHLAGQIKKSDAAALAEVYHRLNKPLVAYIQRFVRDTDTSYDVLQDVFLKLWEQRKSMRDGTHLKAFLYTMARNRSLNVIRKNSKQVDVENETINEVASSGVAADDLIQTKVLKGKIDEWLSLLPPRRAEAFMLSRFHDLKYSEVATIMNLSERTVQTHVLHALRDLRIKLAAYQQDQ